MLLASFTVEKTERLHIQPTVTQLETVSVKAKIPNLHWTPEAILFPLHYILFQKRKFKCFLDLCLHVYIP